MRRPHLSATIGDMPEWEPELSITPPEWLRAGARVIHSTFGVGTVGLVGERDEVPAVWIDFDSGDTKALALEFGLAHLAPAD